MNINTDPYHIADLIYKSLIDSLSPEERLELDKWLENKHNLDLYTKILSRDGINSKRKIYALVDKRSAFLKLKNRIQVIDAKNTRKKRLVTFYKYAAVFLLLISSGYIIFTLNNNGIDSSVEVVETIKPGFEKATLVLGDGSTVSLEKDENRIIKSEDGVAQIENRDNILKYSNDEKKELGEVQYNTLYVPVGGIYKLELPDGSKVWVNSASSIKFPESFSANKRIVELEGEAYFDIVKDPRRTFVVKTNLTEISVLGTSFNVSNYDNDTFFSTTLAEGKIKLVNTNDPENEVILNPGERAVLNNDGTQDIKVENVDVDVYTAWIKGKFYFERETLEDLFKKVGRWYNFNPVFLDEGLKQSLFTGAVSKENDLEYLLKMISKSSKIKYKITKNKNHESYTVEISKK
ncbi:FecR family protein [Joostella sp.]|uniref:FecR family protein n=1 Tax=Joostella sp. TaxID=2231138 RepID=UPI003A93502F